MRDSGHKALHHIRRRLLLLPGMVLRVLLQVLLLLRVLLLMGRTPRVVRLELRTRSGCVHVLRLRLLLRGRHRAWSHRKAHRCRVERRLGVLRVRAKLLRRVVMVLLLRRLLLLLLLRVHLPASGSCVRAMHRR